MRNSYKVALLTFVSFLSQASSTLSGIFLVRFLTQGDYGTYRQAFLIINTLSYFLVFALPASLLFYFPKLKNEERKGFFLQTAAILFIFGFLGAFAAFFSRGIIAQKFSNPDLSQILAYFSFYALFNIASQYVSAMFIGLNRYKTSSAIQLIIQISNLMAILITVYTTANLNILMKVLLGFIIIQFLFVSMISYNAFKGVKTSWKKSFIKNQFSYAVPMGFAGVIGYIGKEIDKYCLALFFNSATYAVYVAGCLEIPFLMEITSSIGSVLVPQISSMDYKTQKKEVIELWKETIRKSSLVFIPVFGFFFILSTPFIGFLYTDKYIASANVFKIYLLVHLLRVFNTYSILQGVGKIKMILVNSILFLTFNTLFNILSLKFLKWGLICPALSSVATHYLTNTVALIYALRHLKCGFRDIMPIKDTSKVILCTIISGLTAKSISVFANGYFLQLIITSVLFCSVFLLCAKISKVFHEDDINLVFGKIISRFRKNK